MTSKTKNGGGVKIYFQNVTEFQCLEETAMIIDIYKPQGSYQPNAYKSSQKMKRKESIQNTKENQQIKRKEIKPRRKEKMKNKNN